MGRKLLIAFIAVQAIGAFGYWFYNRWPALAPELWTLGFLFLLPGNIVSLNVVQGLLLKTTLSLETLSIINLATAIAVNFVLWFIMTLIVRRYRSRRLSALRQRTMPE